MDRSNIVVTIVVPIYNAEKYLRDCLNSIPNSYQSKYEIILVNDGSTDSSLQICKEFVGQRHNVRLINQDNKGVSEARNVGLRNAEGEWICFLDSDDQFNRDSFDQVIDLLKESSAEFVICSDKFREEIHLKKDELLLSILGYGPEHIANSYLNCAFSKFYKMSFLKDTKMSFTTKLINGEDMLFNFEVALKATNINYYPLGIYYFRKNLNSSTNSFDNKIIETEIKFHEALKKIMIENDLTEDFWWEIYNKTLLDGLFVCNYRFALSREYNDFEDILSLINIPEYKNVVSKSDGFKDSFPLFKNMFFFIIKNKKYKVATVMLKSYIKLKSIYYRLNSEQITILI